MAAASCFFDKLPGTELCLDAFVLECGVGVDLIPRDFGIDSGTPTFLNPGDVCDDPTVRIELGDSPSATDMFTPGSYIREFELRSCTSFFLGRCVSRNTEDTCEQTFIVQDTEPPFLDDCNTAIDAWPEELIPNIATDSFSPVLVDFDDTCSPLTFGVTAEYVIQLEDCDVDTAETITRTVRAIDQAGLIVSVNYAVDHGTM